MIETPERVPLQLRISEGADAVAFEVRVAPRASRNAIMGVEHGALKVALTAPPLEGAANAALLKLLAKALRVSKSRLEIVRGERSRNKVVRAGGMTADALRQALQSQTPVDHSRRSGA